MERKSALQNWIYPGLMTVSRMYLDTPTSPKSIGCISLLHPTPFGLPRVRGNQNGVNHSDAQTCAAFSGDRSEPEALPVLRKPHVAIERPQDLSLPGPSKTEDQKTRCEQCYWFHVPLVAIVARRGT